MHLPNSQIKSRQEHCLPTHVHARFKRFSSWYGSLLHPIQSYRPIPKKKNRKRARTERILSKQGRQETTRWTLWMCFMCLLLEHLPQLLVAPSRIFRACCTDASLQVGNWFERWVHLWETRITWRRYETQWVLFYWNLHFDLSQRIRPKKSYKPSERLVCWA